MCENISIKKNKDAINALKNADYDLALELFEQNAEEFPCVLTLNNLAWFLFYDLRCCVEAKAIIEKAIGFNPDSHFPYAIYGDILLSLGEFENAVLMYRKALEYSEHNTINHNLALAYNLTGDFAKATTYFTIASNDANETNSNKEHSIYCLFINLYNWGVFGILKKRMNEFKLEGEDLLLAQLYFGLGDYEKAENYFDEAFKYYCIEYDWFLQYVYVVFVESAKAGNIKKGMDLAYKACEIKENELKDLKQELSEIKILNYKEISASEKEIYMKRKEVSAFNKIMLNLENAPPVEFKLDVRSNQLLDWYLI